MTQSPLEAKKEAEGRNQAQEQGGALRGSWWFRDSELSSGHAPPTLPPLWLCEQGDVSTAREGAALHCLALVPHCQRKGGHGHS